MEQEERKAFRRPSFEGIIPGHILISLVVNVACPYILATEYSQRGVLWQGLLLAALFPLGGLAYLFARRRVLDVLSVGALVVLAVNVLVNIFGAGSTSYGLLQALGWAGPIAVLGLAMLLSQWFVRPSFFYGDRFFSAGDEMEKLVQYDARWIVDDRYRALAARLNLVLGIAQLGLALLLGVALYLFPDWPNLLCLLIFCGYGIGLVALAQRLKTRAQGEQER